MGGECEGCKKKSTTVQRRAIDGRTPGIVPPIVYDVLRSPGQPLDAETRAFMEPRFGRDFSQVRVHTGQKATSSADAVNARAYTVGDQIVIGNESQQSDRHNLRALLAHELTHVVQQSGSSADLQSLRIDGGTSDPYEREADSVSQRLMSGLSFSVSPGALSTLRMQRQPKQPFLVEDAAGGCGVCFRGNVREVGNVAHRQIQAAFVGMYPGIIPNFPISIKGKPFILTEGIPDLIFPTPTGLKIGEIKPANPENMIEGDAKMFIYERLAKEKYNTPTPTITIERLDFPPPPPMPFADPNAINCPQALVTGPAVRGVYGYACVPPFRELRNTCKCKNDTEPKPVPREQRMRRPK